MLTYLFHIILIYKEHIITRMQRACTYIEILRMTCSLFIYIAKIIILTTVN